MNVTGSYIIPSEATHVALVIMSFDDEEPNEEAPLGFGSLEQCLEMIDGVPAVTYNGNRKIKYAYMCVSELKQLCGVCKQRHLETEDHIVMVH